MFTGQISSQALHVVQAQSSSDVIRSNTEFAVIEISASTDTGGATPAGPVAAMTSPTLRTISRGSSGLPVACAGHTEVHRPLALTITSTGTFTGTGFGCTLTGSLASGEGAANGCLVAAFNGPLGVRVEREGGGRIEIEFKRESRAGEVEIEGTLLRAVAGGPVAVPAADPGIVGQWRGTASWSAGSASGAGTVRFTVGADGTLTGSAFGCALNGTLKLAIGGRAVVGGAITASGCTPSTLNVTFNAIEFEREDGDAFEFELEREANDVKVRVKGRVARGA